jgi:hypothetical protein
MTLQEQGERLDTRSRNLAGEPKWIRTGLEIFSKTSSLIAHDWLQLMQGAGDYLLAGIFDADSSRQDALYKLLAACSACMATECSVDSPQDDKVLDDLRLQMLEALCLCEAVLPRTEQPVMFHVMMHVPDAIGRWNSARNFWSFFGERCMGYFIRHIHNRDLAAENIMTAYVRMRVLLAAAPGSIQSLTTRLKDAGLAPPNSQRSFLRLASEHVRLRGSVPGEFGVHVRVSRRYARSTVHGPPVKETLKSLGRSLVPPFHVNTDKPYWRMIGGVIINGRPYAQGDRVIYRRGHRRARASAPEAKRVGTIRMFYHVDQGLHRRSETFVEIEDHPILDMHRSLYIIKRRPVAKEMPGFSHEPSTDRNNFHHIDTIVQKCALVPHFDQMDGPEVEEDDARAGGGRTRRELILPRAPMETMVGIPMWEAI